MYLQTILSNPDLCRMQQRLSLDIRISGDFFSSISGAALNRPPKKKEKRKRNYLLSYTTKGVLSMESPGSLLVLLANLLVIKTYLKSQCSGLLPLLDFPL